VKKNFGKALEEVLAQIPEGTVATCGAVARALGDVRAARAVAVWLLEHPDLAGGTKVARADGRRVLKTERVSHKPLRIIDALPPTGFFATLRRMQAHVARRVSESGELRGVESVGAVDVSYQGDRAFAAAIRCDVDDLIPEESVESELRVDFPYVPTYLAFRELPSVEAVMRRLHRRPDVLFIDGHGRLHPSLAGLACFAGVRLDIPTIGVAKHPLVGKPLHSKRTESGAVPIEYGGEIRGYAWTPPRSSRPAYVSVGHRISLEGALALVQQTTRTNYPEPLRIADRLTKERKKMEKGERGGRQ
jgi:deoxyribonuclease V